MPEQNGEVIGEDALKKMGCVSSNPDDHQFLMDYGKEVISVLKAKNLIGAQ